SVARLLLVEATPRILPGASAANQPKMVWGGDHQACEPVEQALQLSTLLAVLCLVGGLPLGGLSRLISSFGPPFRPRMSRRPEGLFPRVKLAPRARSFHGGVNRIAFPQVRENQGLTAFVHHSFQRLCQAPLALPIKPTFRASFWAGATLA